MVDKQPAGPAPGVLWVNSKLTKPDEVTAETFTKWYQEVHIPDIFKSVGIKSAYRYESVNPDDDRPYLAYYPVEDTGFFDSSDFKGRSCNWLTRSRADSTAQLSQCTPTCCLVRKRSSIMRTSILGTTRPRSCSSQRMESRVRPSEEF